MSLTRGNHETQEKLYKGGSSHYAEFEEMRLNGTLCDVTLRVGSLNIPVHRVVLAAIFTYFRLKFTQKIFEKNKKVIKLKGVDEEAVLSLVKFAYTSELSVNVDNVQSLYAAADYFQIEKIKLFCKEFLIEQLDAENAFKVRELGERFLSDDLIEQANKVISKRFTEVTSSENFLALEKNSLVSLFMRPDLSVKSEIDVFEALKAWINHDIATRGQYTYELLQTIRLTLIESEYLATIAEFPACKSSNDCMQRINAEMIYRLVPSKRSDVDVAETARRGFPQGKVYLLGGFDGRQEFNKIETFVRGNFEQKSMLSVARVGHGVAVLNSNIHITGGFAGVVCQSSSEVFSFSDNKSTISEPMKCSRSFHGCCAHAGKLYVCGGKNARSSTCCEVLETTEGKWRFIANMNVARDMFEVVSCGEMIWAFGGENDKGEYLNSTEFYDEKEDKWTVSSLMNEKRSQHSAVAFRDNIYILGGMNKTSYLNTAEVFDTEMQQFTIVSSMLTPRRMFAAAITGEEIYCFGGYNGQVVDLVESFNMINGEWKPEKNLSQKNSGLAAVTIYES